MQHLRLTPKTLALLVGHGLLLVAGSVAAQTVYRSVGPDGRVTFSDRPPPPTAAGQATARPSPQGSASASGPALPYALQQVVNRFPVTLYTGADCTPCDSARQLLLARGVPFTERTVNSNDDIEALRRLSGDTSLPFGSIGGQQLKGFSDLEWSQFLDAAGYPSTSQLPAQYRPAAPTPLVAVRTPMAPASATAPPAPAKAAPAPPPAPPNPAGITF
ncbi:glutaredoxin family protein [Pseudorhodoferax sp. Leaf267]|uniref:glutaredoxin family protein n=1 Tax=Pseudorhodoferax sp. Leaf267 TaxID=1736316 RepID=UPI0006F44F59|nr:glutaredoxin family protein [Pseudorhodoferax sp. Leaf267]KQP17690.1 NrdH-redoxin [Pseudorhodoferax sp. Leaf267]